MWDEDDIDFNSNIECENWEINVNKKRLSVWETKEEAIQEIVNYVDDLYDSKITKSISKITDFSDINEYMEYLNDSDIIEFDKSIKNVFKELNINEKIKLINLNGDESDFSEL